MAAEKKQAVNLVIVTEQIEQIDRIERSLKDNLLLNTHKTNDVKELRNILSHDMADVVVVDDAESTLGVGSVRSAINDMHKAVPILQLFGRSEAVGGFIKNGATIICPSADDAVVAHHIKHLLNFDKVHKKVLSSDSFIADYQQKFHDLYHILADPICYVHDGFFVDCNPAFLRAFEVSDHDELDSLTILNFVERKEQEGLRAHLRKSKRRDLSASPVLFTMKTKLGKLAEYTIMSKPAMFDDEEVVQVYLRSASESAAGGSALFDKTTGLSNKEQMGYFLSQQLEQLRKNDGHAILSYVLIQNYRDVWSSDGYDEAEKFIQAIAKGSREILPAHTELSRYTDDGLLLYIPGVDGGEADKILSKLVKRLDSVTPEGMERMVEPVCYAAFAKIDQTSDFQLLTSFLFRTARNAGLGQGARVSRPSIVDVVQKDSKRLDILQEAIKASRLRMRFQPIASFDPDGLERYRERLQITDEKGEPLELDIMMSVAERYQLSRVIDEWKMNQLFTKLLAMEAQKREPLVMFVLISADTLKSPKFSTWLAAQLAHTGLGGQHFVFELTTDAIHNAYSAAVNFRKMVKKAGARLAITKIGGLSKDNLRILNNMQPEIIKLDLREIDTLDDDEETEVMEAICDKAQAMNAMVIAEYIESPAQLSRIWPYDIKFIQGDGMTPVLDEMNFNFAAFAI